MGNLNSNSSKLDLVSRHLISIFNFGFHAEIFGIQEMEMKWKSAKSITLEGIVVTNQNTYSFVSVISVRKYEKEEVTSEAENPSFTLPQIDINATHSNNCVR